MNFIWDKEKYKEFIEKLKLKTDSEYLIFNKKIVATKRKMLGIRTPELRKIASAIAKEDPLGFLNISNDYYYEEILLQGLVIAKLKDDNVSYPYFEKWILKIDNWAICDMVCNSMVIINKNKNLYFERIKKMLSSSNEFVIRVGVVLLLDFYVDEDYIDYIFDLLDKIKTDYYYVKMAIAWLVSVCYIKQKEKTLIYLESNHLDDFTYNKAIQKIIESNRVSKEEKQKLRKKKRP